MMGYGDMANYGWIWMTVGIGFWVAVAAVALRAVTRPHHHESASANAEEILRRRYANGEISQNDFESARQTLRRS
jgi:uncharacterized membrane protein